MDARSPKTVGGTPVSHPCLRRGRRWRLRACRGGGGKDVQPVEDKFYGDRSGRSRIHSATAGTSPPTSRTCHPDEMEKRAAAAMSAGQA